ncbi:MAG: ATP/GTP-binding protein [Sulfolobales archaeon]
MPKLSVLFLGPAGSGKTLLTWAFGRWLENLGFAVDYVNLDPAVEFLPYGPSFDARSIVRTREVMVREGLGPNAAIVRAVDILAERYGEVYEALSKLKGDYVLVDTPGQMEIVVFRPSGLKLVELVKKASTPVGVFLLDSTLGRYEAEAAVSVLLATVAQLRLEIPVVPVLSKADASGISGGIVSSSIHLEVEEIASNLSKSGTGVLSEMLFETMNLVRKYLRAGRLIAVSSVRGDGIDELYKILHEVFCACGDLT